VTPLGTHSNKQLGSVAETIVTTELLKRGWVVSTPEGDYAPYDRIATKGSFTHKIQVKSTTYVKNNKYNWTLKHGRNKKKLPSLDDISYFICVATPINLFLIIPYDHIISLHTVSINVDPEKIKRAKYALYLSAWGLLENKGYNDVI
jgi:hypothetical protein